MKKYLCIDLGGPNIKYAVLDEGLVFHEKGVIDARCDKKEELLQDLDHLFECYGKDTEGIGVSMPGIIDRRKGFAHTGGAYLWLKDSFLAKELKERYHKEVTIINDGKAAAMAEVGFGNLTGIDSGVVLIFGTGIAGAIVINGTILDGTHFTAGEFSYLRGNVDPENNRDMFALYNGVQGFKDTIKKHTGLDEIDGLKAFRMIKEDHEENVLAGVNEFCFRLSHFVYNIQVMIDCQRILIGGGLSNEPLFLELAKKAIEEKFSSALFHQIQMPEIMECRFRRDSNLIGALYNHLELTGAKH